MIINNILVNLLEDINDNKKFKIIDNNLIRINNIENYEYNFNTNTIYYKKKYDEYY
jgi:hypothetical protein